MRIAELVWRLAPSPPLVDCLQSFRRGVLWTSAQTSGSHPLSRYAGTPLASRPHTSSSPLVIELTPSGVKRGKNDSSRM